MGFHSPILCGADLEPPDLSQSRLYTQVLRHLGHDVVTGDLHGVGQIRMIRRRIGPFGNLALIPGGIRWRQRASLTARRDALVDLQFHMRPHRISALITNCAAPLDSRILSSLGHIPLVTGGYHARLDLTAPVRIRRARQLGKWRNRLRQAEKNGICVQRLRFDPAKHHWLLGAEAAQRRLRRYRGLPLSFTESVSCLAPDQAQLFSASHRKTRLGAMLFLLHDGAASYHIGNLSPEGRKKSVHNLLLWRASEWLAQQNCAWIDLGPVETQHAPGLARFKLGSGATPIARGASVLYSRASAPLGRGLTRFSRTAVRGLAVQTGRSYH